MHIGNNQPQLSFAGVARIDSGVAALLADETPYNFYSAVIDDCIINRMTDQTNMHATHMWLHWSDITPHSRLLHSNQLQRRDGKFVGLLAWMGLVQFYSSLL
jgi:hypothetical protein